MKRAVLITITCALLTGLPGYASEGKLPVIDGKVAVAKVNDEPITWEEFNRAIAASHATRTEEKKAGRVNYADIMKRLINTRLIVLEGRNMGLDELPEIKNMVRKYSQETLMELLLEQHVKDIKADAGEVEKVYKEIVKEWKITSVRFEKEDAAKKFEIEIKAGNNFEETVKKGVEEGTAKEAEWGKYLKDQDLTLPVAQLVSKMEIGSVSPIISVGNRGFVVFRLEGVRFPENEDPEAREKAKRQALIQKRVQATREYYQALTERYVRMNTDLLAALDYESEEPGLEQLLKDKRIIAEINGEKPVTVLELTKALKQKFYHGIERAIETKSINKAKDRVLEGILQERILLKEALNQGIDETDEYKYRFNDYERSVIFGAFIKKVITPDIKMDIKELEKYYKINRDEYTYPEMMRIKALVFLKRGDAVSALNKLIKGTDFNWLSSNIEGQVDKNTEGLLKFEGKLLTLRSLPEEVLKAVSGAKVGDFRLYASPEGYYYILYIYHVVPAKPKSFEEVKKEVAKEVFKDKVKQAIEAYADQLREYYPVVIYAKDVQ